MTGLPVFTPDSAKLIRLSHGKVKGIHVWDLRLIRRQLKDLGLDWDWPEFTAEDGGSRPPLPGPPWSR